MEWYIWLTLVLSIVGAIWGVKKHIANLFKESGEMLTVIGEALEDGKVTAKEAALIFKESNDVRSVFMIILTKIRR